MDKLLQNARQGISSLKCLPTTKKVLNKKRLNFKSLKLQ